MRSEVAIDKQLSVVECLDRIERVFMKVVSKKEGVKLGRPKGIPGKSKLDEKEGEIKALYEKKVSIASLAKIYGCSWPTMDNFIKKKIDRCSR